MAYRYEGPRAVFSFIEDKQQSQELNFRCLVGGLGSILNQFVGKPITEQTLSTIHYAVLNHAYVLLDEGPVVSWFPKLLEEQKIVFFVDGFQGIRMSLPLIHEAASYLDSFELGHYCCFYTWYCAIYGEEV